MIFLMIFFMISSMKILIFSMKILIFSIKILDFLYENSWWFSLWKFQFFIESVIKSKLSRLIPIFFKICVEPSQLDFFFDGQIVPKNLLFSFFGHFWVEPAQLGFLTFGFSRERLGGRGSTRKKWEKMWFLGDCPYGLWLIASCAQRLWG